MKIACVQSEVRFGQPEVNAAYALSVMEEHAPRGVELFAFPEAFLTGYWARNPKEAAEIAIPSSHRALSQLRDASDRLGVGVIVGYAEQGEDGHLYNAVSFFEPGATPHHYRKTHLPFMGFDRFARAGDRLEVFETRFGRIGLLICYDLRPPEASRVLVLQGAELIVLPTNWPQGAETSADFVSIARAVENRVFVATCNRVGSENGSRFIGRSKIISEAGTVLASADDQPQILIADLELSRARQKRVVNIPGEYELEILASRNPALYGPLVDERSDR